MVSYSSIVKHAETELVIKHSRFIGTVYPVQDTYCAEG